jgi:hypothetical protein
MKMIKYRLVLFLGALLGILLAAGCTPGTRETTAAETTGSVDWQRTVDEMVALTAGLETPEHLVQPDPVKTGDEFDLIAYFKVLDRLSMEPGFVLDYVYWFDEMGGKPVLYAREADAPPYQTYSAYMDARSEPEDAYLNHVQMDGSSEGFFQLAVLRIMGARFYLWWHALMDDDAILTSLESLERHLEQVEADCTEPTRPVLEQGATLALEPRVDSDGDRVRVRLVTFTRWGGLEQKTFTFNRSFPHTLFEEASETLVAYECGVVY